MSEQAKTPITSASRVQRITESAIMIALATVLSLAKLVDLPYGGSITPASALPLIIIAYRYGVGWGCLTGLAYSLTQMATTSSFGWVSGFASVAAVVVLDFLLAFTSVGLAGVFRRGKSQPAAMLGGAVVYGVVRYLCHVIAGATVWAGIAIPTGTALLYSLSYNLTYMLPEVIITAAAAYLIGSMLDFRSPSLARVKQEKASGVGMLKAAAAGLITAALVYDVAQIFKKAQDEETGEFITANLADANWTAMAILTGLAVIAAAALFVVARRKKAEAAGAEPAVEPEQEK